MTREQIIAMAREADCLDESHYGSLWADKLIAFAALIAASEREACLRACEEMIYRDPGRVSGAQCTAAIRARGEGNDQRRS